jgi:hypothetical protein
VVANLNRPRKKNEFAMLIDLTLKLPESEYYVIGMLDIGGDLNFIVYQLLLGTGWQPP